MIKLYDYFRSSACYRVRIALNIKGIEYEKIPVNLVEKDQLNDNFRLINPNGSVPVLVDGDIVINQSIAAIEYLDEKYAQHALLPENLGERAKVRSMAGIIVSDIHPLNNLRVIEYLKNNLGVSEEDKNKWYHHWIRRGFAAIEEMADDAGFCVGDGPTMADACLIPQIFNAKRFECDISDFPKINKIWEECNKLSAIAKASPDNR